MKLKLFIILLFGMCLKNVDASDKKKRSGGRLKKVVGVSFLLLNGAMAGLTTPTNAIVCPTTLPPYSLDMMNYIRCGEKEDTADFFDKYVTVGYSDDKNVKDNCSTIAAVYQKVQNLGKCASEKFTSIVSGAQQKILGKTLNREKELEMFEEYLVNVDGVDDKIEALSEGFEKLKKPDFFQIKKAADFFMKYKHMKTAYALELALTPQNHYQELDFDKVDRMMPYVKAMKVTEDDLIEEALEPKYQIIDFDRADSVRQRLVEHGLDKSFGIIELVEPRNQNLNWDKVIRMIPYAKKLTLTADSYSPIHLAIEPEYQNLDFDKVDRMMPYAKTITSSEYDTIDVAMEPKYQSLDSVHNRFHNKLHSVTEHVKQGIQNFTSKMRDMIPYAKKLKHDKFYMQILEATQPKYQKLDFDKADYIQTLLLKTTSNKFDAATNALSDRYQNYDVSRVRKVFEGLDFLILNNSKFAAEQALLPWIQKKRFVSEKVEKIFNDCKKSKNKESCWKLKTKDMRKVDL